MTKGTRPAAEDTATGASSAPPQRPARAQVAGEAETPGTAAVARYREQCAGIVERVRGGRGDAAPWDDVLADTEANEVVLDAQVAIALQFQDPEIGTTWMVDLVNGHLRAPDGARGEAGDAAWKFAE